MVALPNKKWTAAEYIAFEQDNSSKHEFISGEVVMMAGASENHNLIVANMIISLGGQLRKRRCTVYPSDMLVRIVANDDHYYPNV